MVKLKVRSAWESAPLHRPFATVEEAGMFVKNLLGIASDHDHGIVNLRILTD